MGLRVGLLTEKYPPDIGGLAAHSERTARLLSRHGVDVVVLAPTSRVPAGDQQQQTRDRITEIRFGVQKHSGDTLQDWHDLAAATTRKAGLDLLHALHASYATYVAVYTGRYCGVPSVASVRGADMDSALVDPRRMPLVSWGLEKAEAVCAPSAEMGKRVHTLIGDRTVYLVPPSVDAEVFRRLPDAAELRRSTGLEGARVVGYVGEAKKKKGLVTLLKAFSAVAHQDLTTRLVIVGAVKREDAHLIQGFLKANPAISKLVQLVKWCGAEELARWYNRMDVVVIPSLRTSGTGPALEALACETPAVVSDAPGARDVVRHEQTGLVFPVRDDAALADQLRGLLRDDARRRGLGTAGRSWVLGEASPEKEREALLHAYDRALGRGEAGRTIKFEVIPGQRR